MQYMKVVKRVNLKSSHHKKKLFSISLILYLCEMMNVTKLVIFTSWCKSSHLKLLQCCMSIRSQYYWGKKEMLIWLRDLMSLQLKWETTADVPQSRCTAAESPRQPWVPGDIWPQITAWTKEASPRGWEVGGGDVIRTGLYSRSSAACFLQDR